MQIDLVLSKTDHNKQNGHHIFESVIKLDFTVPATLNTFMQHTGFTAAPLWVHDKNQETYIYRIITSE